MSALSSDQMLAAKTEGQLREALRRGAEQLRTIDSLEATEEFVVDGPFPLSKGYEVWSGRDYAERRRQLNLATSLTEQELLRRGPDR